MTPLSCAVKFGETESTMVIAKGRGNWESVFNEYKVSVWEDGKVLEMDGDDGCITMRMYLMPLNRTLKKE